MTREEAMNKLLQGHELDNECKRLIIEKFQQELGQEPCEDCVSRKDIIEILTDIDIDIDMGEGYDYNKWRDRLEELPSVYPARIHAKWVGSNGIDYKYFNSFIVCSNCKKHPKEFSVFCPNCGAQMDLEGEDGSNNN